MQGCRNDESEVVVNFVLQFAHACVVLLLISFSHRSSDFDRCI
jgi:hypothetical protein